MIKVNNIQSEKCKIYDYEIEIIKKLLKFKTQQKLLHDSNKNKNKINFKIWYKENRYSLNTFFYNIMTFIDNQNINLHCLNQNLYNKFIEFAFNNSILYI